MATQRGYYREEMERAIANLEMALTHLSRVVAAYQEAHPEVSDPIKACGDGIVAIAEVIQQIHETV